MDENTKTCEKDDVFDPSVEMLVNSFDDERTLEEEEALAANETEDPNIELSDLHKESDMPIEELLVLYGYGTSNDTQVVVVVNDDDDDKQNQDETMPSKLHQLYSTNLNDSLDAEEDEEDNEEGDEESTDEEGLRKKIQIGYEFQAIIPEGLSNYDDALPYENEDKLLWDPSPIPMEEIDLFLLSARNISSKSSSSNTNVSTSIKDDEQALYLLLQCGYNTEEALRRMKINTITTEDAMTLWSDDECKNFECGLKNFGKDFHQIQQKKVRTRSVGELVQFYYLWKKTERHDSFMTKERLEKKKTTIHSGTTDFMDKFIDDENNSNSRDTSSSPTNLSILNDKKSNNFRYLNQNKYKPRLSKLRDLDKKY